jgi:hypothetical protein
MQVNISTSWKHGVQTIWCRECLEIITFPGTELRFRIPQGISRRYTNQTCFILKAMYSPRWEKKNFRCFKIFNSPENLCLVLPIFSLFQIFWMIFLNADKPLARPTSLSIVFSIQGTSGSPTGPDPGKGVCDQEFASPDRPVSSVLQLPDEPFPSWSG